MHLLPLGWINLVEVFSILERMIPGPSYLRTNLLSRFRRNLSCSGTNLTSTRSPILYCCALRPLSAHFFIRLKAFSRYARSIFVFCLHSFVRLKARGLFPLYGSVDMWGKLGCCPVTISKGLLLVEELFLALKQN